MLCAQLRQANIDACEGAVEELERIVSQIRGRWPEVEIWIRGDSGFAREEIMAWCQGHGVHYVLGWAKNSRLIASIEEELEPVRGRFQESKERARASS